jgi:hypothetical protein
MARRCLDDIEHIKRQLADGGVTFENQDLVLRQREVAAAQAIIAKHVLPEWRMSAGAPRALEGMAQDIADAMQAARGGTALLRR